MPELPKSPFLEDPELNDSGADATRVGGRPDLKVNEAALKGYLTVIVGEQPGRMFELSSESMTIGRGPECDVRLDSDGVSRKHASIRRLGEQYLIEDLKSTNGTFLDGVATEAGVLTSGVRIRVGTDVIVRFNLLDDTEAGLQLRLYESGIQDTSTGANNRRYFDQTLATEISQANRLDIGVAVLLVQIDDMKAVNDYYTQAGGEAFLRELVSLIRATARAEDIFARTASDQFGIISRGISKDEACALAEKIREGIEQLEVIWQSGDFSMCIQSVTARFAVVTRADVPAPATPEAIMKEATQRLAKAKEEGGNTVVSG